MVAVLSVGFVACGDKDDDDDPVEEATKVFAKAMLNYKPKTLETVYMVVYFDEKTQQAYKNCM